MKVIPILALLYSTTVLAQDVRIAGYDIPALIQKDGTGEYDQKITNIQTKLSKTWQYKILPPARADKLFDAKALDCIFPYDRNFHPNKQTINSLPLGIAQAYIYSNAGSSPIVNIKQLQGLRIGARIGMLYGPEFDSLNLHVEYVTTLEQNIDKIKQGRIDAFVAWSPDSDAAFERKKMPPLPHGEPFVEHNDAILCHDTLKNRAFINNFNQAMLSLKGKMANASSIKK